MKIIGYRHPHDSKCIIMSRKLKLAAKEKDQTKINGYTKGTTNMLLALKESANSSGPIECTPVTSISTVSSPSSKELVVSAKRKHSQESTPPNTDQKKKINMSSSPQGPHQVNNSQLDETEDESTLSPELAKLERILSRKQASNLEGIKNDIKKLLENEELIRKQQDTITELKKENQELKIKYNRLEQKHHRLQNRVVSIENELFSSNLIFSGIPEGENEEGPERVCNCKHGKCPNQGRTTSSSQTGSNKKNIKAW